MNSKNTWFLLALAALLAVFIYGWEKYVAAPARQPLLVLPGFEPASITSIQIRVSGHAEVTAERTESGWQLTKPLAYPARPERIDAFLAALETLSPESYLSPRDLMNRPNAEAEFGFDSPAVTMMLFSGNARRQLLIGAHTAPGDQVFVEIIGIPGIHLVSTNFFDVVPATPGVWRETALLDWDALDFDRLQVNNGQRTMELFQNATNQQWRLVRLQARADNILVNELLRQFRLVQVDEFITDDPDADLDQYGLETPELEMIFTAGTNLLATLEFGGSPTNGTNLVYGRRGGSHTVFTVPADALKPWLAPATEFRDRHLVSLRTVPQAVEIRGDDQFTLVRQPDNQWRVMPQDFLADTNYAREFILALAKMQVVEFVKDVVTEPDLPAYGLAPPMREYLLNFGTNANSIGLLFGSNRTDVVYTKRSDEPSVSAVRLADFLFLPAASWELRDRRIWQFTEDDVARVQIEQDGRKRELIRNGTNSWSLAEGSFGSINTFGVEETIHRLGDLSAAFWTARGQVDRTQYGFTNPPRRLTIHLKNGGKHEIEFGGEAPSQFPYARVTLDGEPWILEFPWATWQYIQSYLSIPVREL